LEVLEKIGEAMRGVKFPSAEEDTEITLPFMWE